MSWSNTWTHTVAVAVDIFTASVFWNHEDVTVSSLCGLELRHGATGDRLLCTLGRFLNRIQANHCELAIAADRQRAEAALKLLS